MKKLHNYIAWFLLLVFAWVLTPTHTIHSLFADHDDTADNYCRLYHSHLGTHIEDQHTHCDILKLNSPVYDVSELVSVECSFSEIITSVTQYKTRSLSADLSYNLPSRAPPVA